MMKRIILTVLFLCLVAVPASALDLTIFKVGELKSVDSVLKVKVGDMAPDFELPSITGKMVRLSDYRGKKNVIISFVPAAWTPVCSDQWPGYNIALPLFEEHNAQMIGITTDNVPSLYAWSEAMNGLHFPVVSDFWPHGKTASEYGVLRSTGVTERALFIIDTKGIIRFIEVHDINTRPDLAVLVHELEKIDP